MRLVVLPDEIDIGLGPCLPPTRLWLVAGESIIDRFWRKDWSRFVDVL